MIRASGPVTTRRTEQTIAAARVLLAATSLFAVWLDPAEPARFVGLTYGLLVVYVAYSVALAFVVWLRERVGWLPVVTHVVDIALFSVVQYLTLGPGSPFFAYFIFSLFCGALRWGWRGTLATAILVLPSFVIMGAWMSRTLGSTEFELNRFIIRIVYLAVTAALLVYLGQHEIRLRAEIERLARWPSAVPFDSTATMKRVLAHAAGIVGADRAVAVWEAGEEPWVHLAAWSPSDLAVEKHRPGEHELARHPALLARLGDEGYTSAPFQTERVSGLAFFTGIRNPVAELWSLSEVVAREMGSSLDQLHAAEQLREIAASEQRIKFARDLHDGVLQSLTGIRFELQAIATTVDGQADGASRDRLLALERALAIEQRELRLFIDSLNPAGRRAKSTGALVARLEALRERVVLEWKVPVALRVHPESFAMSSALEGAIPLMVHEAIVNALKHAKPSHITVDVALRDRRLVITVTDDGRGFPFTGRYNHRTLTNLNLGPVSLRERASSLGGEMTIDSSDTGSRVEIAVPLAAGGV